MDKHYLFQSKRLGFRNWRTSDLDEFAEMNADLAVMEHFPKSLTKKESAEFIDRLIMHFQEHGYNYFAMQVIETGELIGFIGLALQQYHSAFTPAVDIGWRLKKSAWGNGFATEGAKRCLSFAFTELNKKEIIATCTKNNAKSEHVMRKIGMEKIGEFLHPKLKNYPKLQPCLCYRITKNMWQNLSEKEEKITITPKSL